jgi:hypothetical protein
MIRRQDFKAMFVSSGKHISKDDLRFTQAWFEKGQQADKEKSEKMPEARSSCLILDDKNDCFLVPQWFAKEAMFDDNKPSNWLTETP